MLEQTETELREKERQELILAREELQKARGELTKVYNELRKIKEELLEVKKANQTQGETKDIDEPFQKIRSKAMDKTEESQEKCSHPVWYFLNGVTDWYEGKSYWTCQCVNCGKITKEERSKEYPNDRIIWDDRALVAPIRSKLPYEKVVENWVQFMDLYPQECKTNAHFLEEKGQVFAKRMNPHKK